MFRRMMSSVTLVAFMLYTVGLTGCTQMVRMPMEELDMKKMERGEQSIRGSIISLQKKDGTRLTFDKRHGRIDPTANVVVGHSPSNEYLRVPVSEVAVLEVSRVDGGKAGLVVGGVALGFALLLLAASNTGLGDSD
ncbi:MAG: hypothetical protein JSV52_15405 [Candidatus Zixiibacteriota bacterium]|nr:MAG: hypothetical protein JSV52_15405 [candidate division Zixibacteria bacterium]